MPKVKEIVLTINHTNDADRFLNAMHAYVDGCDRVRRRGGDPAHELKDATAIIMEAAQRLALWVQANPLNDYDAIHTPDALLRFAQSPDDPETQAEAERIAVRVSDRMAGNYSSEIVYEGDWTKDDLVIEAGMSDGTFRKIVSGALAGANPRGFKGQGRRYTRRDVGTMLAWLEGPGAESVRDSAQYAASWRALLNE